MDRDEPELTKEETPLSAALALLPELERARAIAWLTQAKESLETASFAYANALAILDSDVQRRVEARLASQDYGSEVNAEGGTTVHLDALGRTVETEPHGTERIVGDGEATSVHRLQSTDD